MASENARRKLRILGERVAKRSLTEWEATRLAQRAERDRVVSKQTIQESIAETLDTRSADVQLILASHDDSDRIIEEIIDELK